MGRSAGRVLGIQQFFGQSQNNFFLLSLGTISNINDLYYTLNP
ncbi:hypothetical protein ACO1KB_08535 [Leptospira interrogans serovar Szwajizak]|nr:hypothetical protein [Leptospira interrogans]